MKAEIPSVEYIAKVTPMTMNEYINFLRFLNTGDDLHFSHRGIHYNIDYEYIRSLVYSKYRGNMKADTRLLMLMKDTDFLVSYRV